MRKAIKELNNRQFRMYDQNGMKPTQTAEKVKNAFLGLEHRQYTLLKVFERYNEDYEKLYKAGMKAKSSLSNFH